jgi:hypothetical protein
MRNVNAEQAGMGIAGAHGLDDAGRGYSFDDPVQERLAHKVGELTEGSKDTPLAAFRFNVYCWQSYNTTLRDIAHCTSWLP